MINDSYRTLSCQAQDEYIVKHSRFIGYAKPVKTEKEAQEFIAEISKKHWDAKHNVYAYSIREGGIKRYSDDGEPQGTAGMPVLNVILQEDITDCVVVVTRYFGGILLGGGGLVRAYTQALQEALKHCPTAMMKYGKRIQVDTDYNGIGKILYFMGQQGLSQESSEYTDKVRIIVLVPGQEVEHFCKEVTELTAGRSKLEVLEEVFYPVPEK